MNRRRSNSVSLRTMHRFVPGWLMLPAAALLLVFNAAGGQAQTASTGGAIQAQAAQTLAAQAPAAQSAAAASDEAKLPRDSDRRLAAKLYLSASKLFMDERYEEAIHDYEQAARLDGTNANYRLAGEIARSHAVTALIQTAAKDRLRGDAAGARATLVQALQIDPRNIEATQHLYELGDDAARMQPASLYEQGAKGAGGTIQLAPEAGVKSFHLHNDQRQLVQQVFKAYGISATVDDSVQSKLARFDIDDVSFDAAASALAMVTHSFYVAIDARRVLVASDTRENRLQFTRQ